MTARVPKIAVNIDDAIPIIKVTAKPCIGPVPKSEQHDSRDKGRNIRVGNGTECLAVTRKDRCLRRVSEA